MHAFRCALSFVTLVFEEVFFAGSASLQVFAVFGMCFFCNLFWGVFWGDGMKGFGVLWSVDVL